MAFYVQVFIALMFSVSNNVISDEIESPNTIPNSIRLNAEELIEAANSISNLILIDSRTEIDHKRGFIPSSISLPDVDTNCHSLADIIENKITPILFYCNGPRCKRSANAVKISVNCGYEKIYWFRGGFDEWKSKKYPIEK